MVAFGKLGYATEWVSVMPEGPLGQWVLDAAEEEGVSIENVIRTEGQLGNFTVIPGNTLKSCYLRLLCEESDGNLLRVFICSTSCILRMNFTTT